MDMLKGIYEYIARTGLSGSINSRYYFPADDAVAVSRIPDRVDAVALAFLYGRAKGYRAAKAEAQRMRKNTA